MDEWPRRSLTVARSTPFSSRRLAWLWRTVWRLAPLGSLQRPAEPGDRSRNRIRPQRYPVRVGDDEVQIAAVAARVANTNVRRDKRPGSCLFYGGVSSGAPRVVTCCHSAPVSL